MNNTHNMFLLQHIWNGMEKGKKPFSLISWFRQELVPLFQHITKNVCMCTCLVDFSIVSTLRHIHHIHHASLSLLFIVNRFHAWLCSIWKVYMFKRIRVCNLRLSQIYLHAEWPYLQTSWVLFLPLDIST